MSGNYLKYSITYDDDIEIEQNQLLSANSTFWP